MGTIKSFVEVKAQTNAPVLDRKTGLKEGIFGQQALRLLQI